MTATTQAQTTLEQVKDYYGKKVLSTSDLKTGACCTADAMPLHVREILPMIEPEIKQRFYGCGSPIPPELTGRTVLDLGCGTGRDAYMVSKLVGESGKVIGVDMTEEQLAVARQYIGAHTERFGYARPNIEFHKGYIEDLASVGIADDSVDVVISNCVINLSPVKERVFSEIFRVLKPGGELYFSDIFASRRIPAALAADSVLRGECLGGAMYIEDFRRMLAGLGCPDFRSTASSPVSLNDPEVEAAAGMIDFQSITVRAFKLDKLEDVCEDYGQVATYKGTLPESPHTFRLDDHHTFVTGKPMLVCGNTAAMVQDTRYGRHFTVLGDRSTHLGRFDCKPTSSTKANPGDSGGACC